MVTLELFVARAAAHRALAGPDAEALLSHDERAAADRFLHSRDRAEHIVARALTRSVLAARTGSRPEQLRFGRGTHGRPRLEPGDGEVDFNLAHCDGVVVCLVGPAAIRFGIDVETTTRARNLAVADDFFAPAESAGLRALPAAEQLGRFYVLWTLKESYIKARGLGLAIPLHTFHFDVEGARPEIAFESDLPRLEDGARDDPGRWAFELLRLGNELVAVGARDASPLRIAVRDVTAIGPSGALAYGSARG